jgi:hypothetical protein
MCDWLTVKFADGNFFKGLGVIVIWLCISCDLVCSYADESIIIENTAGLPYPACQ